jgi:hypothetical protein
MMLARLSQSQSPSPAPAQSAHSRAPLHWSRRGSGDSEEQGRRQEQLGNGLSPGEGLRGGGVEGGANGPPSLLWPRRKRHNRGAVEYGEGKSGVESGVLTPVKTLSGNLCFNVVRDSQGIPQSYMPKANCAVLSDFDESKHGNGKQVQRADLLKLEDLAALTTSAESEYATAALTLPTGKEEEWNLVSRISETGH